MFARYAFPVGYALAFFCAFVLQIGSVVVQRRLVEENPSSIIPRRPLGEYLGQLPTVLRENVPFRQFIIMSMFLVVASMPAGFFMVYALKELGGTETSVGQFTFAIVSVQVVSSFVTGYIADHFGHKAGLLCAASGMLCASLWALIAPSLGWFVLVFAFLGINLGSEMMMRYNMVIEYGSVEQRSTYIGLMNTVVAPFYLVSIAGGWIVDHLGYHAVFLLGALSSIVGILLLMYRVIDPRLSRTPASASSISSTPDSLQSLRMESTP